MIALLIFCMIVTIIALFAWILYKVLFYCENNDKTRPKIKFKSFLIFYDLNKDRWELVSDIDKNILVCKTREKSYFDEEEFRFGFTDYYRYRKWRKRLNKKKERERHSKKILKMMEAVKKDIASMEEISKNEIEKGKTILNEIKW